MKYVKARTITSYSNIANNQIMILSHKIINTSHLNLPNIKIRRLVDFHLFVTLGKVTFENNGHKIAPQGLGIRKKTNPSLTFNLFKINVRRVFRIKIHENMFEHSSAAKKMNLTNERFVLLFSSVQNVLDNIVSILIL